MFSLVFKKTAPLFLLWFVAAGFLSAYLQDLITPPKQQAIAPAYSINPPKSLATIEDTAPVPAASVPQPGADNPPVQTAAASGFEYDPIWDKLAKCESSGNWQIDSGNGFYGGLQFQLSSWRLVGGSGYPHHATKQEQILRAEKLRAIQGWQAWPECSIKLGLR